MNKLEELNKKIIELCPDTQSEIDETESVIDDNDSVCGDNTEREFVDGMATNLDDVKLLNRENDQLPFGYFEPTSNGSVYWICAKSAEGNIISTFHFDDNEKMKSSKNYKLDEDNRIIRELETMEEAVFHRNELIKNGWRPLKDFKNKMTYKGKEVDMKARKYKRYLNRKMKKVAKKNPGIKKEMEDLEKELKSVRV